MSKQPAGHIPPSQPSSALSPPVAVSQDADSAVEGRRENLRAFDLTGFIRARREMRGSVRVAELGRLAGELPADAPADAGERKVEWLARGESRREVRREAAGSGAAAGRAGGQAALTASSHTVSQPYLVFEARGQTWLECQRCMKAMAFPIDINTVFKVMESEDAADAIALDEGEAEIIVGSQAFDVIDLIDEEIMLSLPMVPKHDVCPTVHQSVVSGADGSLGVDSVEDIDARLADLAADDEATDPLLSDAGLEKSVDAPDRDGDGKVTGSGRPNPFAALSGLKKQLKTKDDGDGNH